MPASDLELIPVIHARGGELVGPDAQPLDEEIRTVTRRFSREHNALYLVDLDGLRRNRPEVTLLQEIGGRVHTWADGGSRTAADAMDLIVAGAEQVTIRHHTAEGPEEVEEAVRMSENIALGMEFRGQQLVDGKNWSASPPELRELAERLRIPLVVIDHDRAGTRQGVDRSVAWHARNHPAGAYYAGGISRPRDLGTLSDLGYKGALVSTALIEGENLEGREWEGPVGHRGEEETDEGSPGPDPMGGAF